MYVKILWSILLLYFIKSIGYSQDSIHCSPIHCDHRDLSPNSASNFHVHPKGSWMFNLNLESIWSKGWNRPLNADGGYLMYPASLYRQMQMFMLMYGVSDRLNMMLMMHYCFHTMDMSSAGQENSHHHSIENHKNKESYSGIGDAELSCNFSVLKKDHSELILTTGVRIPTGKINEKGKTDGMYEGLVLPYAMQQGAGTFGLSEGLSYILRGRNWQHGLQVLASHYLGKNSYGYRMGDRYTMNIWSACRWNKWVSNSVRINGSMEETIKGKNVHLLQVLEPSANTVNYGGYGLSVFAGTNFYTSVKSVNFKIAMEFGVPVLQKLNGLQLNTRYNFQLSLITLI